MSRRSLRRILATVGWVTVVAALALGALAYHRAFRAVIDLSTEPSGAQVRIDGRLVGVTPLQGAALTPGIHLIEISHSHYAVHEQQLNLAAGDHVQLDVRLDPGTGTLAFYSNPRGGWVEVDGLRQDGTTPLLSTLPSGPHQVVMGMEERRTAAQEVVVMAGQTLDVRMDLDIDPHGSLRVETDPPDARVSLPAADVDYQPGVRLQIGEYPVRVSRPGYLTRVLRLKVGYGDNVHHVALERAFAALVVRTDPADARVRVRYRETSEQRAAWREHVSGTRVPVGPVEVRASAMGRRSAYRQVEVSPAGITVNLVMARMNVEAGARIRDALESGGSGPQMVVVPAGEFVMGSATGPVSERPPRRITIAEPFAVGVSEVTAADYRRFARATGRSIPPPLAGLPDDFPAVNVSFADAAAYADWLSVETGARYRLPSEAEWEYMARAGSEGVYSFGDDQDALCRHGNVADSARRKVFRGFDMAECDDGFAGLAPVAAFAPNAFGIHDVHGNAAEWVLECGLPSYAGAPDDGTPIDEGVECPTHGVRGGSWDGGVSEAASRKRSVASSPSGHRGMRLLREL